MQLARRLKFSICIAAGLMAIAANAAILSGAVAVSPTDWFWVGLFPQLLAAILISAVFKYCFFRLFGEDPGEYRFNAQQRPAITEVLPIIPADKKHWQ